MKNLKFSKEIDTYSHKAFILEHILETFLNKLVCSTNKIKIVYVIELQENNALVKFTHNVQYFNSISNSLLNYITSEVTRDPKSQPAPRGLTAHVSISSGSLHIRSQNGPSWGISQFLSMTLICQMDINCYISNQSIYLSISISI